MIKSPLDDILNICSWRLAQDILLMIEDEWEPIGAASIASWSVNSDIIYQTAEKLHQAPFNVYYLHSCSLLALSYFIC